MPRAVIVSCSGPRLTPEERALFRSQDPLGLIVFARNIENKSQLYDLTTSFRMETGRSDAPVLIDQEGGRVARLRPPHWRATIPAARYGELYRRDPSAGIEAARLNAHLMADELAEVGITVDCAPDADLAIPGAHSVIGDRSYGETPEQVAALGRAAAEGLLAGGVLPVVKHMPGHGRTSVDTHKELPVVTADRATLRASDFAAFKPLADLPWGMTGHIVFQALDPDRPATQSATVIRDIIRGEIGFSGFLVSDDLCMGALSGDLGQRTEASLAAGCDTVLVCDGKFEPMRAALERALELAGSALRRYQEAEARRTAAFTGAFDRDAAIERHNTLIGLERAA